MADAVREQLSSHVVRALYRGGLCSVDDLAAASGVSRMTVNKTLDQLVDEGLVEKVGRARATRGRSAALWRIGRGLGHVVGVDVGPTTVRARVDDIVGPADQFSRTQKGPVPEPEGEASAEQLGILLDRATPVEQRLAAIERVVSTALESAGVGKEHVWAACAVTPGIVDAEGAITVSTVIDRWQGDLLRGCLARCFGPSTMTSVENDGNAAAMAEAEFGAACDVQGEVVSVYAGRRLGLGIIRDGRLHRGRRGRAGEVGNLADGSWKPVVDWLTEHRGQQPDVFAAAAGLPESSDGPGGPTVLDDETRGLISEFARLCAYPIAEQTFTYDPDMIVLGGPLVAAGDAFIAPFEEALASRWLGLEPVTVRSSPLGRNAVLLGATVAARLRVPDMLIRRADGIA